MGPFLQVTGAAGRTTDRGHPDRAYGNSVLPRRRLAEFLDQIPGPLDDPENVHIRDAEDQPSPVSHRLALHVCPAQLEVGVIAASP
jgi:hypothetical protein